MFLFVCLLSFFVISEEKGYAQNNEKVYLSDEVLNSLTGEDLVKAYDIMSSRYDITQKTEDELNEIAALVINEIHESKINENINYGILPKLKKLNAAEMILAAAYPAEAILVYKHTETAENTVAKYYNNPTADNGNANAFKHAFWSGIMLKNLPKRAGQWTTAHEMSSGDDIAVQMDLHNNHYGRQLHQSMGSPSDAEFAKELMKRIDRGELKRKVNNNLVPTDSTGKK